MDVIVVKHSIWWGIKDITDSDGSDSDEFNCLRLLFGDLFGN